MKYLKKYKLFESSDTNNKLDYVFDTLDDICLELSDMGVNYIISPTNTLNRKILGFQLWMNDFSKKHLSDKLGNAFSQYDPEGDRMKKAQLSRDLWSKDLPVPFFIIIDGVNIEGDIKWYIDFLHHIESYMSSIGLKTSVVVQKDNNDSEIPLDLFLSNLTQFGKYLVGEKLKLNFSKE